MIDRSIHTMSHQTNQRQLYSWEKSPSGQGIYRGALVVAFGGARLLIMVMGRILGFGRKDRPLVAHPSTDPPDLISSSTSYLYTTCPAAFLYWAYSQPTEFDSLVAAQRQFMHDLYEGNLLADVAQVRTCVRVVCIKALGWVVYGSAGLSDGLWPSSASVCDSSRWTD